MEGWSFPDEVNARLKGVIGTINLIFPVESVDYKHLRFDWCSWTDVLSYAHVITAITAWGASLILNSSIFIKERKGASLVPKKDSDTAQMQKILGWH